MAAILKSNKSIPLFNYPRDLWGRINNKFDSAIIGSFICLEIFETILLHEAKIIEDYLMNATESYVNIYDI